MKFWIFFVAVCVSAQTPLVGPIAGGGGGGGGSGASPAGSANACQNFLDASHFGGDATVCQDQLTALSDPGAPTVTQIGTLGMTNYIYSCAATSFVGPTAVSPPTTTMTGFAALDGTHKNRITCPLVTGAYQYRFYAGAIGIGNISLLAIQSSNVYDDDGSVLSPDVLPSPVNLTKGVGINGSFRVGGHAAFGANAGVDGLYNSCCSLGPDIINAYEHVADSGPTGFTGISSHLFVDPPSDLAYPLGYNGLSAGITTPAGNTKHIASLVGMFDNVIHNGSGLVDFMTSRYSDFELVGPATCTLCEGVQTAFDTAAGSTVVTGRVFSIDFLDIAGSATTLCEFCGLSPTSAGVIGTLVGLDLPDMTRGTTNFAIRTGLGTNQLGDQLYLARDMALPFLNAKTTASATAPGAGKADMRWVAGTNMGTCKLVSNAGTSATEVTIVDNVGGGC
jgi:hypothetical protein